MARVPGCMLMLILCLPIALADRDTTSGLLLRLRRSFDAPIVWA